MDAREDSILLHVCCAPCLAAARATLRGGQAGGMPAVAGLFFYNPNIHPLLEFRRRGKALRLYLERDPAPAEIVDAYGLALFLDQVDWRGGTAKRCAGCYALRLGKTAERTAALGLKGFTSTLLASREQDRDSVERAGAAAAEKFGVKFFPADLRRLLPDEKLLRGIYRQQYCGCVFSENERFRETSRHVYFPEKERGRERPPPAPD